MTKYVLNSGGVYRYPEKAQKFFAELVVGLGQNPKILVCCFAQPREDWETKFAKDVELIPHYVGDFEPQLELAFPDTFETQMYKADIVYFHGGDDHLIRNWLERFDLEKICHGKVVATNSASSNAISTAFWTCDWRQNFKGLGILPIEFISHYHSDYGQDDPRGPINWDVALTELEQFGHNLPIHALEEGDYVVIEK
jgi:hypothetical protein